MRSVWRGAIAFGLVTIGVRMYTATEEHDFRFNQVHREDGGRIKYKRVCSVCGEEVQYGEIAKGYELEDGRMVIMEPEDFDALPLKTDHAIDVLQFVSAEEVDSIYFQKTYYLEPDKTAQRPYALLRDALEKSDRLAVVKITMRQRETLAMVRARDDLLVLHMMLWPDEVRTPDFAFLDEDIEVRDNELKMANSLIDSMSGAFDPNDYTDDYTDAMARLIEQKADGAELPEQPEEEESTGEVIDLMSALEQSVARAKQGRGDSSAKTTKDDDEKDDDKPARKTATRSKPAKAAKAESADGADDKPARKTRGGKRTA